MVLGCGEGQEVQQSGDPARYPVIEIERRTIEDIVQYPASIEGVVNSQVRAKMPGYIQQVMVDEGEWVKKGQPMFRLETQSLTQDAEAARARVRVAQVEVDKLQPLVAQEIISEVQLETARANLEQAKSVHQSILANIGYANINSPVDGVVGTIPYRSGNLVSAQDAVPLTTVSSIVKVYAYFSMNEKDYISFMRDRRQTETKESLNTLPPVTLKLADGSVYEHKGTIETISGSVDPASGTVRFRAVFPNPEGLLRNGSSGTILLSTILDEMLVVPTLSTFEQQGKTFVYLVQNDSLHAKSIQVIAETAGLTVIEGLNEGETILAKGVGKVSPNSRITPYLTSIDSIVSSFDQVFK
jgi:membrane fusion protein (multidrug efflux system)